MENIGNNGMFDGIEMVDLSYAVWQDTPRERPIGPVRIYTTTTLANEGYFESRVDMSGHCSTHMDTASLMYEGGAMADEIPIQKLIGRTVLANITHKAPGETISKEDIINWEKENTQISHGDILFVYTGMQKEFGKDEYIDNWIGINGSCAQYLAEKGIKAIGTDSCAIDALDGKEKNFPAHHTFLKNNIPIIEDLCNLDKLPDIFSVIIAPLKLCNSSGAPARVIAFFKKE